MINTESETPKFELRIELFEKGMHFSDLKFNKSPISIGRAEDCDINILDKLISRIHARLIIENGEIYLEDLGSSNGTFVNGQKISKEKVNTNSLIKIGNKILKIAFFSSFDESKDDGAILKEDSEIREMTLSRIAMTFQSELGQLSSHQDQSVMTIPITDRNFVNHYTETKVKSKNKFKNPSHYKIESLVVWNNVIYDINEFGKNQIIDIGPLKTNAIQIQSVRFNWTLSRYDFEEAHFEVPNGLLIYLMREGEFLTREQLAVEGRIKEGRNTFSVVPSLYDVVRIELDNVTQLYFRYVPSETDLEKKKLISPDEFLKKAIRASVLFHIILSVIIFVIPSDKMKPVETKKEPERIARLIMDKPVEPPPPPPPEPEPKKEDPPPPEPPKPEPPKPEPPKPKPKPEVKKPKPVMQKPKVVPVQKAPPPKQKEVVYEEVEVEEVAPVTQKAQPAPVSNVPSAPKPAPVDVSKLGALAAISGLKISNSGTNALPKDIKIDTSSAATKVGGVSAVGNITSLANNIKQDVSATSAGNLASGPMKTKGKSSAGVSYGGESIGNDTGKRGVKGGGVKLSDVKFKDTSKPEGLSREQIMKVMQSQMSKIQSCYERALLNDSNLAGRIEFEWEISAAGSVSSVEVKKNSVAGGEQLGECVSDVIRGIKFPSATNGQTTKPSIGFPFGRL